MIELINGPFMVLTICVMGTFAKVGSFQEFLVDNGHRHVDIFYNSSQLHEFGLKDVFASGLCMSWNSPNHE